VRDLFGTRCLGKLSLRCVYWWGRISICSPVGEGVAGGRGKGGDLTYMCLVGNRGAPQLTIEKTLCFPCQGSSNNSSTTIDETYSLLFHNQQSHNLSFACDGGAVPISQLVGWVGKKKKKKGNMWWVRREVSRANSRYISNTRLLP